MVGFTGSAKAGNLAGSLSADRREAGLQLCDLTVRLRSDSSTPIPSLTACVYVNQWHSKEGGSGGNPLLVRVKSSEFLCVYASIEIFNTIIKLIKSQFAFYYFHAPTVPNNVR